MSETRARATRPDESSSGTNPGTAALASSATATASATAPSASPSGGASAPSSSPSSPPGGTLSQKVLAFVSLVAIQVVLALSYKAAQGPDGRYAFDPASLMVVAEALKCLLSVGFFTMEKRKDHPSLTLQDSLRQMRDEAVSHPSLPTTCLVLAVLYAMNNSLVFIIFQFADGANINLIKGGSSVVSTLMLRYGLGRDFSGIQWAAVLLQVCGLVVAQFGASCTNTPILALGVYAGLFVSLSITAFCSVVNEKVLKEHSKTASLHTVNAMLYTFGVLCNGLVLLLFGQHGLGSLLVGFGDWATYPVLLCNSLIGIAVSAVYKYTDATMKTFGSACATSILLVLNIFSGYPFRLVVIMGCATVFIATHLYANHPPPAKPAAPKPSTPSSSPASDTSGKSDEASSAEEGHGLLERTAASASPPPAPSARPSLLIVVVSLGSLVLSMWIARSFTPSAGTGPVAAQAGGGKLMLL